uniref:Uncharacterized protein n=1 Tax=Anguilla anguilla TaxID=7936 RepID=A0A0E9T5X6_ANGAN
MCRGKAFLLGRSDCCGFLLPGGTWL